MIINFKFDEMYQLYELMKKVANKKNPIYPKETNKALFDKIAKACDDYELWREA